MKFVRTVTYEIEAEDLEDAENVWADDGPEYAETGRIGVAESSDIEPLDDRRGQPFIR